MDVVNLLRYSTTHLFAQIEELDREATQDSAFVRGVACLRSIQVPLERFKLALDVAAPLTNLDPTAATVFGMVRSVTAVSIRDTEASVLLVHRLATDCYQFRDG